MNKEKTLYWILLLFFSCTPVEKPVEAPVEKDSARLIDIVDEVAATTDTVQPIGFSTSSFPESWDINRELRGNNTQVLAWYHHKDGRRFEYKCCLTLMATFDTAGQKEYFIEELYAKKKPFNEWNTGSIHYGPTAPGEFGFHDLHLELYSHLPSKEEIYKLLNRWMFSFEKEGYVTMESGMDTKLWLEYFHFYPDKKFGQK